MKILHTADWHLGKSLYGRSLLEDQKWFLNSFLLPLLEREHPDALVVAGDLFDRQVPPVEAITLLDDFYTQLHKMGILLIAVAGNHDSAKRLSLGSTLLRESGIILATRPEELFHPIELTTASGKICFWTLPFCEPAQIRELLGQEEIHSMDEAFRAMIEKVEPKEDAVNVLVTHCFAAGGQIGASESPAFVGGSAQVGTDLFEKFDYTALGHLHGPQKAGKGRYSGSPLTYSFDEANQKKSVTMVEWKNGGQEITEIPVCPPNKVRVISGNFEELLEEAKENPSEDYLFAELCDTKPIYLPLDQLRPYYPNLLGLSSQWLLSKGEGDNQKLREQIHHRADDLTIFEEFMEQICGIEADEEDKKLIQKMLRIDLEQEEEKAE